MDGIRQYILSVAAAGLLCATVKGMLPGKGLPGALLRLVCGVFLTFVLLSPVKGLEMPDFSDILEDYAMAGDALAREGKNLADEAMAEIIKAEAQSYILDKARLLREDITVEIGLDEALTPARAVVTGTVSPYGRAALSECLESLGIAKEAQTWIG